MGMPRLNLYTSSLHNDCTMAKPSLEPLAKYSDLGSSARLSTLLSFFSEVQICTRHIFGLNARPTERA